MSKWKKTTLGAIASIITGPFGSQLHQSDYVDFGTAVIMPQNIRDREVDFDGIAYVNDEDAERLKRYRVEKSDLVYSRRGDVEKHAFITETLAGALCGTGCLRVRFNSSAVHPDFISMFLNKPETKKWLTQNAVGSNMPNLNTEIISAVPIAYPEKKEQIEISKILSAIDKKIALNNRIIAELEAIAKTIYDYWFVQFDFPNADGKPYRQSGGEMEYNEALKREIPTGWEAGNLYNIADFVNGLACQKYRPADNENGIPVVKIKEMHDGITSDTELVSENIPEKHKIYRGDILFSWSATLEVMLWFGKDSGLNQHIFKVVPKTGFNRAYVFHQLSAYIINFVKMAEARKTTMGHITTDHLEQSQIALPKQGVLEDFSKLVLPLHERILKSAKENLELTHLRDWLLPLLMNGQARVD